MPVSSSGKTGGLYPPNAGPIPATGSGPHSRSRVELRAHIIGTYGPLRWTEERLREDVREWFLGCHMKAMAAVVVGSYVFSNGAREYYGHRYDLLALAYIRGHRYREVERRRRHQMTVRWKLTTGGHQPVTRLLEHNAPDYITLTKRLMALGWPANERRVQHWLSEPCDFTVDRDFRVPVV